MIEINFQYFLKALSSKLMKIDDAVSAAGVGLLKFRFVQSLNRFRFFEALLIPIPEPPLIHGSLIVDIYWWGVVKRCFDLIIYIIFTIIEPHTTQQHQKKRVIAL